MRGRGEGRGERVGWGGLRGNVPEEPALKEKSESPDSHAAVRTALK